MHRSVFVDLPGPFPGKTGWPWIGRSEQLPETMPNREPWPRISIVTPSYNQGQFIEETIRSVLLQGYPNLEYSIIDGGSTDNSVEVIQKYAPWLAYWVSEPDRGQSDAINKGLSRSTGEILHWLNSDDVLYPNALQAVAKAWVQFAPCHFLTGDGDYVTSDRSQTFYHIQARAYSFAELLDFFRGQYLPQPAVFFSRSAFQQVGGVTTDLAYAMDLDLWLRLRRQYTLYHIPVCLAQLRSHAEAKTWRSSEATHQVVRTLIQRNLCHVNGPARLRLQHNLRLAQAGAVCQRGLEHCAMHDMGTARADWWEAMRVYPGIVLSLAGWRLLARLVLPAKVQHRLFRH